MKTRLSIALASRNSRRGSAVIVILVLLMIMVVLAAANTATLNWLRRRIIIVDQRQTQRLASISTNALRAAASATNQPISK
jgi:type II secretory pathway component PulK